MLSPYDNKAVKSIHVGCHCLGKLPEAKGGQKEIAGYPGQQNFPDIHVDQKIGHLFRPEKIAERIDNHQSRVGHVEKEHIYTETLAGIPERERAVPQHVDY